MSMERNDRIAIAVLRGWPLKKVGWAFGLSAERVRQLTIRTIKRSAPGSYQSVEWGSLKGYRKNKYRIIEAIKQKGDMMEEMTEAQEDRIFSGEAERKAEEKMRYEDIEAERKGEQDREGD